MRSCNEEVKIMLPKRIILLGELLGENSVRRFFVLPRYFANANRLTSVWGRDDIVLFTHPCSRTVKILQRQKIFTNISPKDVILVPYEYVGRGSAPRKKWVFVLVRWSSDALANIPAKYLVYLDEPSNRQHYLRLFTEATTAFRVYDESTMGVTNARVA